jgi:hypothetical protein
MHPCTQDAHKPFHLIKKVIVFPIHHGRNGEQFAMRHG